MKLSKSYVQLIMLLCICFNATAQIVDIPPDLEQQLQGKIKYADIIKTVDKYYTEKNFHSNPKLFKEYKRWNRWAWWASRHLNNAGEPDIETGNYFDEALRIRGANSSGRANSNGGLWSPVGPVTTSWGLNRGSRGIGRIDRLAIHPTNANIILAGSPSGGLWRTNDGGLNWFSISSTIPNCGIAGIVISSSDPSGNTIYILTGQKVAGNFLGDYRLNQNSVGVLVTTNGGGIWSKLGNSETVLRNMVPQKLIQLRGAPNVLIAATLSGLYSSRDFGATWALVPGANAAIHDVEQHTFIESTIYFSTATGVGRSVDTARNFITLNSFSPATAAATRSQIALTRDEQGDVYYMQCGTSNSIYRSTDGGTNFTRINTQNLTAGQDSYNYAFAINPVNKNLMAAAGVSLSSSTNNGVNFGNTTNGNINVTPVPTNYLHSDIHDLMYTPNGGLLYAACDGGVAVSSDNGVTWTDRSNGLQCTQYYHAEGFEGTANLYIGGTQDNGTNYTTNGTNMVYAGSGDGFMSDFVNTDNNVFFMVENTNVSRFTRSTNQLAVVSPGTAANQSFFPDVVCHPTNGQIVYAGYSNSIWRSANRGGTWTQVLTTGTNNGTVPAAGLSRGFNGGFAVSSQQPDRLYAATANTVLLSNNQGTNWSTISGTGGWPAAFGIITDIATRNNNADEVWVTTTGNNGANRILYSSNAGASWVNYTGSLPSVPIYSIFYTTQGDAYIGTELGVYYMAFTMNDWVPFFNGLPLIPVTDIFVNEATATITAATFGRGLWESDLYTTCSPFLFLNSDVNGSFFYQTNGLLQSTQNMNGSYGNSLRYRSPTVIKLTNGFKAKAGSYFHAVIGACGQGVFARTAGNTPPVSKGEYLKENVPGKNILSEKQEEK